LKESSNIFLIGPMGAGKSTIGRSLARKLHMHFYDSDQEIERHTGAAVALIFEIEGEQGFRKREAEMIAELTHQSNIVLATGGGAVLDAKTREILGKRGFVVYLRTGLEHLLRRTAKDTKRPLLKNADPGEKLRELMFARGPLYEALADLIVDTGQRSVPAIINEIVEHRHSA